jgi:heme A synthase
VAALFGLSVTGMLVLNVGTASTACPGWPVCGRGTGPVGLVVLQYLHRSFALLATAIIVIAAVRAWRCASAGWTRRALAVAALALLAGTATFGAIVATTGAPATEQDFHLAVASALWIVVVSLATPGAPSRIAIRDASAAVTAIGAAGQG